MFEDLARKAETIDLTSYKKSNGFIDENYSYSIVFEIGGM